eukprot:267411-Chlamydomonas_euryale.AAC.1
MVWVAWMSTRRHRRGWVAPRTHQGYAHGVSACGGGRGGVAKCVGEGSAASRKPCKRTRTRTARHNTAVHAECVGNVWGCGRGGAGWWGVLNKGMRHSCACVLTCAMGQRTATHTKCVGSWGGEAGRAGGGAGLRHASTRSPARWG